MKKTLLAAVALMLMASFAHAQVGTTQVTNTVSVNVAAEAALTIGSGATSLTSIGTNFANYTGSTPFTYFIRTGQSSGTGTINLQVTTDFSPTGGPSVATPPTSGDALTYTCTVSSPGTACSGSQTSSSSVTSPVASFGANAHSTKAGNSASVAWILTNDPLYQTGSYSAVVTFTISAS